MPALDESLVKPDREYSLEEDLELLEFIDDVVTGRNQKRFEDMLGVGDPLFEPPNKEATDGRSTRSLSASGTAMLAPEAPDDLALQLSSFDLPHSEKDKKRVLEALAASSSFLTRTECTTTRRHPDDIKLLLQVQGQTVKRTFFVSPFTRFSTFRKAVEKKVGKVTALCYWDQGVGEKVEVDDEESFVFFLEKGCEGGRCVLEALMTEPPPKDHSITWTVHDWHRCYAGSSRPLRPVDVKPAPHTVRAPPLLAFRNISARAPYATPYSMPSVGSGANMIDGPVRRLQPSYPSSPSSPSRTLFGSSGYSRGASVHGSRAAEPVRL